MSCLSTVRNAGGGRTFTVAGLESRRACPGTTSDAISAHDRLDRAGIDSLWAVG